jgi:hypothetical protein
MLEKKQIVLCEPVKNLKVRLRRLRAKRVFCESWYILGRYHAFVFSMVLPFFITYFVFCLSFPLTNKFQEDRFEEHKSRTLAAFLEATRIKDR